MKGSEHTSETIPFHQSLTFQSTKNSRTTTKSSRIILSNQSNSVKLGQSSNTVIMSNFDIEENSIRSHSIDNDRSRRSESSSYIEQIVCDSQDQDLNLFDYHRPRHRHGAEHRFVFDLEKFSSKRFDRIISLPQQNLSDRKLRRPSEMFHSSTKHKLSDRIKFHWLIPILLIASIAFIPLIQARHYIAPGPCTWTHVVSPLFTHSLPSAAALTQQNNSDIHFKSSTLLSSSSSSSKESNHRRHNHQRQLRSHHSFLTSANNANEFYVSLHCLVPVLTPYTLNLSSIDPQHTIRLTIQCSDFGISSSHHQSSFVNNLFRRNNGYNDLTPISSTFPFVSQSNGSNAQRSTLKLSLPNQPLMSPFEHIRLLQSLSIENCLLDRLSTDTFRGLTFLRNLTIKQTVPIRKDSKENLTQNDRIDTESLVIERLAFRHIESAIENLDLSQNNIKSLPNDLFCPFLNLQTLNLSNNALANLTSFGLIDPATGRLCLQELYDLDLSNNRLESVPETSGVAALKNLQNLNLSYNKIIEITELTFSALRKLSILDLSNNNLRSLPNRTFRDSDELKELNLAKNNLIRIPSGLFQGLSKLQVLNMADNQIVSGSIGGETFADLIRVIVMNFSGNKLRQLSASAFQNQYSLQVLLLENNDLETIEEGTFATLYNLHTLKLSGNRFQHLPESIFTGLFVLNELHLSGNLLEHIHDDAFKNCTHLKVPKE